MQAEVTRTRAEYGDLPHSASPEASPYSFPPPARVSSVVDEYRRAIKRPSLVEPSGPLGDFLATHRDEGNFLYTARPASQHAVNDESRNHVQHDYSDDLSHLYGTYSQPRTMSLAGLIDLDSSVFDRGVSPGTAAGSAATFQSMNPPTYRRPSRFGLADGASIPGAASEPMQRVISTMQAGEYTPHQPQHIGQKHHHHNQQQQQQQRLHLYHNSASNPSSGVASPHVRPYTFGTATGSPKPQSVPYALGLREGYAAGPPGPPLEWAKPRTGGRGPSALSSSESEPRPSQSWWRADAGLGGQASYVPSLHQAGLMMRTTSNESGLSSYSGSTVSSSQGSSSGASFYERGPPPTGASAALWWHIAAGNTADRGHSGFAQPGRSTAELARVKHHPVLADVSSLRIGESEGPRLGRPTAADQSDGDKTIRGLHLGMNGTRAQTLRDWSLGPTSGNGTGAATTTTSSSSNINNSKRRVTSNIFHPPPQAMLAPGAFSPSGSAIGARHADPHRASLLNHTTGGLPTDDEFATLPTKRSRGRRPPVQDELAYVEPAEDEARAGDGGGPDPTEAQIAWAGLTKSGKPRKIFLCKVPGCGKCFKRSEHLKRHVRSIHTNERPFQCQWPTCKRLFSRHDNLNQHLRIHREPGMSDAEFSAALELYFGERLAEVQAEHSWFDAKAAARERLQARNKGKKNGRKARAGISSSQQRAVVEEEDEDEEQEEGGAPHGHERESGNGAEAGPAGPHAAETYDVSMSPATVLGLDLELDFATPCGREGKGEGEGETTDWRGALGGSGSGSVVGGEHGMVLRARGERVSLNELDEEEDEDDDEQAEEEEAEDEGPRVTGSLAVERASTRPAVASTF